MIIKNTDPYKTRKCIVCKKEIILQEKYFTYPLSLQSICLDCSLKEIPKIIEALETDLEKTRELLKISK
ncbi:MAG TPA: hypothetical protein VH481_09395 [Nitrososphaeraceae archaeon]|jgi:hypothetical protein